MYQGQGFGQSLIQAQRRRSRACDLRYFNGVRQTAAKMIRRPACKNLRLPSQSPKSTRLHNPLPVSLERSSAGTCRSWIDTRNQWIGLVSDNRAMLEVLCHSLLECTEERSCNGRHTKRAHLHQVSPLLKRPSYFTEEVFSFDSFTRALSSLCCTFATSSGSASAFSDLAYSFRERSHCSTASFSFPVRS